MFHTYFTPTSWLSETNHEPFSHGQRSICYHHQRSSSEPVVMYTRDARVGQRNFLLTQGHSQLILSLLISIHCSCFLACDLYPDCKLSLSSWKSRISSKKWWPHDLALHGQVSTKLCQKASSHPLHTFLILSKALFVTFWANCYSLNYPLVLLPPGHFLHLLWPLAPL
jgi:hypothetical protein